MAVRWPSYFRILFLLTVLYNNNIMIQSGNKNRAMHNTIDLFQKVASNTLQNRKCTEEYDMV